ncbi:hypothetical protein CLIB1444_07S06238 [[Candida] jaroonii]|uniref:Uncharacterized protein n=1 Tax=[Candida] jaroonii TaxID=467808 RepID=A0ACA9YBG3_9ASCO|nr:hypothetical protein CLIB1444_07S06238 [[Candida] jaroonii]
MAITLYDIVDIYVRKSDDDDDKCSQKKYKDSAECQKPSSEDGLTIGLAVALPAVAVILVLGFFLFRNYRKNKKEDMEHDPDFDENGEATVLPDFPPPRFQRGPRMKGGYEMEDPFDNRNSVRYPNPNEKFDSKFYQQNSNNSSASITASHKDAPVESFVLPYQHQIGSKVSLDEYARQLGGYDNSYNGTPRGSFIPNHGTRNSSLSNINYLHQPLTKAPSVSPQKGKSNLKYENKDYQNIPNHSMVDTTNDETGSIEEVSDSDEEEVPRPNFAINYENESEPKINSTLNNVVDVNESTDTFNTTVDHGYHQVEQPRDERSDSPFDDHAKIKHSQSIPVIENEEQIDGDFDFSNDSGASAVHTNSHDHETANTSTTNLDLEKELKTEPTSKFDDDEFDDVDYLNNDETLNVKQVKQEESYDKVDKEEEEDEEGGNQLLSAEQEEELKRMKSVYKLYFDRENSVKRRKDDNEGDFEYQPDLNHPLPLVDTNQFLTINKDLKADTDYNKRLTTTSSIYTDMNEVNRGQPEYQYAYQEQPYDTNPQQEYQQYSNYLQDPNFQQFYQEHIQSLPPLQHLPHPSDIRQSTIQTYTDYQPRSKNTMTSPTMKQPFVPIENDNVWTSPVSTPTSTHAPTFENTTSPPIVPSATQISRSSVVMLNPVTEITKQRKFKPAGSLPTHANNHAYANYAMNNQRNVTPPMYQKRSNSSRDLIPEGKNDVRRMMTDNF